MAHKPSIEESAFVEILQSMGVYSFDANVPAALNEYARRKTPSLSIAFDDINAAGLASELLCDAKDYAGHAGRQDIQPADIATALKLCDSSLAGIDHRDQVINEVKQAVNKKGLVDFADPNALLVRYPKTALTQRAHTYVPGIEAYGEFVEAKAPEASDAVMEVEDDAVVVQTSSALPEVRERVSMALGDRNRDSHRPPLEPSQGFS